MTPYHTVPDRRQINLALLSAVLWPAGVRAGPSVSAARTLFDFAVAGGSHHGLDLVLSALLPGERLSLRPEPDNPHDGHAVAIDRAGVMIGYMPREASARVSRLLASGRRLAVEVVGPLHPSPDQSDLADLVFTSFSEGDPRLRLIDEG